MAKENKTNAMRLLEKAGIPFTVITYEVDETDLSGVHVAAVTGVPAEQVFKTLVARGDKTGYMVACIPVADELNLKALATVSGNKKVEMIAVKELLPLTGYMRGGCSPIGMKKSFPTYIDETAILHDRIAISAGIRGAQLMIAPEDLVKYIGAQYENIV